MTITRHRPCYNVDGIECSRTQIGSVVPSLQYKRKSYDKNDDDDDVQ